MISVNLSTLSLNGTTTTSGIPKPDINISLIFLGVTGILLCLLMIPLFILIYQCGKKRAHDSTPRTSNTTATSSTAAVAPGNFHQTNDRDPSISVRSRRELVDIPAPTEELNAAAYLQSVRAESQPASVHTYMYATDSIVMTNPLSRGDSQPQIHVESDYTQLTTLRAPYNIVRQESSLLADRVDLIGTRTNLNQSAENPSQAMTININLTVRTPKNSWRRAIVATASEATHNSIDYNEVILEDESSDEMPNS